VSLTATSAHPHSATDLHLLDELDADEAAEFTTVVHYSLLRGAV
jgi:hypothetical protein